MSSQVDIINMALSRLAATRITSLDDGTVSSQQAAAIWDLTTEYVQSMGPWPCNKFRAILAQSSLVPGFGYRFQYQLPTNPQCLRVLRVNEDVMGDIPYQIENGFLLTDEGAIGILYCGLVTDPGSYDPFLKQAIVDHLVAELAYKITGSKDTAQAATKYAADHMQELLNVSSVQGSTDDWPSNEFINVRNQGVAGSGTSGDNGIT